MLTKAEPADDVARIGRRTAQRATVLSALAEAGDLVSAQGLHDALSATGSPWA